MSGWDEIRTHETQCVFNSLADCPLRPLGHPSKYRVEGLKPHCLAPSNTFRLVCCVVYLYIIFSFIYLDDLY